MNDYERSEWVDNDEGLYNWWKQSGLRKRTFIIENRAQIDTVISNINKSKRPTHYLAY